MIGIPKDSYNDLNPDDKKYADEMLEFMHPMSPRRPGNVHEAEIKPLSGEELSSISVPTIVLHARDDILVAFEHAEFIHENIKHSELVSFDRGGHALVAELKVITRQIKDFLARNR
jgi:pimeloyl-ACP methyl ester carboxylesterase